MIEGRLAEILLRHGYNGVWRAIYDDEQGYQDMGWLITALRTAHERIEELEAEKVANNRALATICLACVLGGVVGNTVPVAHHIVEGQIIHAELRP